MVFYELGNINVEVVNVECIGNPNLGVILQADLFRWIWLRGGGVYLDSNLPKLSSKADLLEKAPILTS